MCIFSCPFAINYNHQGWIHTSQKLSFFSVNCFILIYCRLNDDNELYKKHLVKMRAIQHVYVLIISKQFQTSKPILKHLNFLVYIQWIPDIWIHSQFFKMSYYVFKIKCRGKMSLILINQLHSYFRAVNLSWIKHKKKFV